MAAVELSSAQQTVIENFALERGFPPEILWLYLEAVAVEWGHKLGLVVMQEYATIVDYFSPDYHDWAMTQNNRLKRLRIALATTEVGQATLAAIPAEIDDGEATIPVPSVPEELIVAEKKKFKITD